MFIKDLQPRQTNVDVEGDVIEVSDVREFSKFGRSGRVANAFIKDGTGKVKLSLWNEQIEQVRPGDKVKVTKGYVSEFQGELQLTTGKFGTLEVVKDESVVSEKDSPAPVKPSVQVKDDISDPEEFDEPTPAKESVHSKKADDEESLDVEEEDFS